MSHSVQNIADINALLTTLTHRQLVHYMRVLNGGSVGFDYMKASKHDMAVATSAKAMSVGFEAARTALDTAFPQGIFHRGQSHTTMTPAPLGAEAAGEDSDDSDTDTESETPATAPVNADAKVAEIRGLIMDSGFKSAESVIRQLIADACKPAQIIEKPVYIGAPAQAMADGATLTHAMPTTNTRTWAQLFNVRSQAHAKRTITLWDGAHPETPAVDPSYVWPDVTATALTQLERGKNVFFYGPPGTGKTHWTNQYAAKLGRPFALIACDDQTDAPTLVGMTIPAKDGGTAWQDGILTRAIQTPGCVICVDEPSLARAGALMVMQNILAHRVLYIAETGRRVPVAHGVQFIACDNTNGTGGGSRHGFTGTGRLNAAFLDRFGAFCHFEYLTPAKESAVIAQATRCTKALADLLVSAATTTRQAAANGSLTSAISLRVLFAWAELLTDGVAAQDAFEAAVLNRAPEQDREALRQQCLLTYDRNAIAQALAA